MKWKRDTAKFSHGELLELGQWNVGEIHYDSFRTKDDPLKYAATCKLPGVKQMLGHFEKKEEAREKVEKVVKFWLSKLPPINQES